MLCVFLFLCVFALSTGERSKSVVFVEKCRVFVCFLGKVTRWGSLIGVHDLLDNIYICVYS